MDRIEAYTIPFRGLKNGIYEYGFRLGKPLFEAFGSEEIKDGECAARVRMERRENGLSFDVAISGSVVVECDRCLEDCSVGIEFEGSIEAKFSDEVRDYDGEVLWLMPGQSDVDLAQYLYESVVLSLPYQRVHPEGQCDPAMMERFRIVTGEEFGAIERRAEQRQGEGEWEKLAALRRRMEAEAAGGEGPAADEAAEADGAPESGDPAAEATE